MASSPELVAELFDLKGVPDLPPRYNIAPTQSVPSVVADEGSGRVLRMMHWGLVPRWAKDPSIGSRMINARSETVAEKPSFRSAMKRRRCLIPADGFYEWKKTEGGKQPYYIQLSSGKPFAFAGLHELWTGGGESALESCTIITTTPNELMAGLHNRMPVIISEEDFDEWLEPVELGADRRGELLAPWAGEPLVARPVSRTVNSPRNDSPACVEETELDEG